MTITDAAVQTSTFDPTVPITNDFTIVVATENGSGSQTANNALIRAMFKMGIPVSGKNLFPSNIQGLPTWYSIRISKDGYTARRDVSEILVAYNPRTSEEDLSKLPSGGVCVHPADLKFANPRSDVVMYAVPVKELVKEINPPANLRDYIANMSYVGVLMTLLGIERTQIEAALMHHFNGKRKAVDLNMTMVDLAGKYAADNLPKQDPFRVATMDKTAGQIIIDGNTAAGIGAVASGVSVVAWYPITPSTSLVDAITEYAPKLRPAEEGRVNYAIIQAEDELAAAGIIVGAGWAGCRAMTATSGPGISLMNEFAGLAYFAEVPIVIWDIMRMGPSTGLPTRVSQGDIQSAYYLGHGDSQHICLLPGSMQECFEFAGTAFDLAELFQTPVIVLSDLDLGMNNWMTAPFDYPSQPLNRGKVLHTDSFEKFLAEHDNKWGRYRDIDGDGIPYRTIPGNQNPRAAWLGRGTGHNEQAVYSERNDDWQRNMDRLTRKHDTARTKVPAPVIEHVAGARVGIIAYGSSHDAVREARHMLSTRGVASSYMRLRALPLNDDVSAFVAQYDEVYVVELNQDSQMLQLLCVHAPKHAGKLRPVNLCDGLPLTATFVLNRILAHRGA
ncbi:MAG: 2-oxoacid:acceptor oxidoreductase subunit alpha [Roseiflexaceae bacterium]